MQLKKFLLLLFFITVYSIYGQENDSILIFPEQNIQNLSLKTIKDSLIKLPKNAKYYYLKRSFTTQNTTHLKNKKNIKHIIDSVSNLTVYENHIKHNKVIENNLKPIDKKNHSIELLEKNLSTSNTVKYILYGVSTLVLFLLVFQYRKRKELNNRFNDFIKEKEKYNIPKKEDKKIVKGLLSIPEEVAEKILSKLNIFENEKKFTSLKLNLSSLAKDLDTNSNYLSKVINHQKGVNFSQYINELRINYALKLLDTDTKIRKYSIKGIAEEVGYKNAESFSNAFYKKTGLKPSYYIRQLEKVKM